MRHQIRFLLILLCVGFAGATVTSCKRATQLSEEDRLARVDDKGADKSETPRDNEIFPATEFGLKLKAHMLIMALPTEMPEEADRRYSESLAELRKSQAEVVQLLTGGYNKIEATRYFERWGLTKTLADLNATEAYETLVSIARAPLPPELNKDLHHFSTQEEEVMIRLRAIEGLTALATQGHEKAGADLLALAIEPKYQNRAVQTRAIKGYLRAGQDHEARAKLLQDRLPKEMHGVVTLNVTPQKEFETQVNGLASIAEEKTTRDKTEEGLPEEGAPVTRPKGEGQDNAK
jgi:hypothetical protein